MREGGKKSEFVCGDLKVIALSCFGKVSLPVVKVRCAESQWLLEGFL